MRAEAGDGHEWECYLDGEDVSNRAVEAVSVIGGGYVIMHVLDDAGRVVHTNTDVVTERRWGRVRLVRKYTCE